MLLDRSMWSHWTMIQMNWKPGVILDEERLQLYRVEIIFITLGVMEINFRVIAAS